MVTVKNVELFLRDKKLVSRANIKSDHTVSLIRTDSAGEPGALAWVSAKGFLKDPERIKRFRGTLLICPSDTYREENDELSFAIIYTDRPKLAFLLTVNQFFGSELETRFPERKDIAVHPTAKIGEKVTFHPGVVIGANVQIGNNVVIGPNTVLANCKIGDRTTIGANCTIGLPGFGYEKDAQGIYHRFPHMGGVIIGVSVEIGSNTCIDRGALGDTKIDNGCKIDNLVHIAHNVVIGENSLVIANSMIAGSVTIGPNSWIAPSSSIMNQKRIGKDSVVGMGAVVIRDVDDSSVVIGNPARLLKKEGPNAV